MKISKLVIYGFGRHEDRTIELHPELSILAGPNEAGKTTIQQFIIQTLFGYPVRGNGKQRYEPKKGGKFGGQLHIEDPIHGRLIVERVSGKSAGHVTVYFEDGRRGGEEELQYVTRNFDRSSFESIFSFSVHQLQGLDRMTEEELSRTLLASGTTGMDAVTALETKLEREMGLLFKKSGRNPEINRLVEELRTMETDLKKHRTKMEIYVPFRDRIEEIEAELGRISAEETAISKQLADYSRWKQAAPLIERQEELEKLLADLPSGEFPPDGHARMERLSERLEETEAKLNALRQEKEYLLAQSVSMPDIAPLAKLLSQESEWHRRKADLHQKQVEQHKIQEELDRLLNLIGMTKEKAAKQDVSLYQEEELLRYIQEANDEEEDERFRTRKLEEEKIKLSEWEAELDEAMRELPSEQKRKEAQEWPIISRKLAEARAAKQRLNGGNSILLNVLLLFFGLTGLVTGIIEQNYFIFLPSIAALAAAVFLFFKKPQLRLREYDELLKKYDGKEAEFEALCEQVRDAERKVAELERICDMQARKVEKLILEQPRKQAVERWNAWLRNNDFPPEMNRATAVELLRKLREIQSLLSKLTRIQHEAAEEEAKLKTWQEKAEEAGGFIASADNLYTQLHTEMQKRQEKRDENERRQEKIVTIEREQLALEALSGKIEREISGLLDDAAAANKDAFYRLHTQHEKKQQLLHELVPIKSQLTAIGEVHKPEAAADPDRQSIQLQELKRRRELLLAEKAEKAQTLNSLETDASYAQKQQLFEGKKAEFASLAKQWAVNQAAAEAIRRTMTRLKEKRLPEVLERAQQLFSRLTLEEYSALTLNVEGSFEAVRKDGARFGIAELSQATKEQAYLALRLALAIYMKKDHPFPVIMDDPFVHFDRSRLQQVVNLMDEMKKDHQFLYFTCHESMQTAWPKAHVINVAATERSFSL